MPRALRARGAVPPAIGQNLVCLLPKGGTSAPVGRVQGVGRYPRAPRTCGAECRSSRCDPTRRRIEAVASTCSLRTERPCLAPEPARSTRDGIDSAGPKAPQMSRDENCDRWRPLRVEVMRCESQRRGLSGFWPFWRHSHHVSETLGRFTSNDAMTRFLAASSVVSPSRASLAFQQVVQCPELTAPRTRDRRKGHEQDEQRGRLTRASPPLEIRRIYKAPGQTQMRLDGHVDASTSIETASAWILNLLP